MPQQIRAFSDSTTATPEAEDAAATTTPETLADSVEAVVGAEDQGDDEDYSTPEDVSSTKVYVGNMNWDTSNDTMRDAFAQYGEVLDAYHVVDRYDSSMRRGFGFVTFSNPAEAEAALAMDGGVVDGRPLRVTAFNHDATRRTNNRMGGTMDFVEQGTKVYVGNLSYDTSSEALREVFSEFGDVQWARHISFSDDRQRNRGFGFVVFNSPEAAAYAVETADGLEVDGRYIRVSWPRERESRD